MCSSSVDPAVDTKLPMDLAFTNTSLNTKKEKKNELGEVISLK